MQKYYTDEEIRAIILREKKKKKRRIRVAKRCTVLLLLLIFIVFCVISLVRCAINSQSKGLIFLDPGHGGVDGGATSYGRNEKDDTLKLALAVRDELEELGYTVEMSRTEDVDLKRANRGKKANKCDAELFVSIHRNQATEGNGVEVWIPSDNNNESRILGQKILRALEKQGFYGRGVRAGTLKDSSDDYLENSVPNMPSCLVEVGFISDSGDNKLFDNNFKENAKAIAKAIVASYESIYQTEEDN